MKFWKAYHIVSLVVLIGFAFAVGCTVEPETSVGKEERLEKFAEAELPREADKVMDLGNNWYSFELDICGKKRVFLFHRHGDYSGESKYGLESITEIQLEGM